MDPTPQQIQADEHDHARYQTLNRIIKRYGGRHLIFRTGASSWWFLPGPRVLVSSFRGFVWTFYGFGQIWITHKKTNKIGGWMARAPRLGGEEVQRITFEIEEELKRFIDYCNETGIEGTVTIEKKVIEFHWTFGYELTNEKTKEEHARDLDQRFKQLVDRYLEVNPAGT